MDALDVFHVRPDGSFAWIGSADSLPAAFKVIETLKIESSDAFLILDWRRSETFTVHADTAAFLTH